MEQYANRKQNRLQEYDYSSAGAYFITVCTADRKPILWTEPLEYMKLSFVGNYLDECIQKIPAVYPNVSVEKYCIMPDHFHVLILLQNAEETHKVEISRVVKQLKRTVSKQAGGSIWQKGFYDHVVRDNHDFCRVWEYIANNPLRYQLKDNP